MTKSHLVLDLRGKVYDWKSPARTNRACSDWRCIRTLKSINNSSSTTRIRPKSKSVVSRFTMSKDDPNRADPDSEMVLMEIDQPFQNHNGGAIEFGPDGYSVHRAR